MLFHPSSQNETDGNWHTLFWDDTNSDDFARHRAKACMVEVSDNEVALIGGTPVTLGDVIDVYNIEDKTFSMDHLTLPFIRSHLSCTHIPQGVNGNPTVAICKYNLSLLYRQIFKSSRFQSYRKRVWQIF